MTINHKSISHSTVTCFDAYLSSFEDSLTAKHYAAGTIKIHRVLVRNLATLMEERGVRPEQLTVELAAKLTRDKKMRRLTDRDRVARRFVEHLIKIGVATAPVLTPKQAFRLKLQREFEDYLRRDRGLSNRSIYKCWRMADRFLNHCFGERADELGRITPRDVAAFLRHVTTRKPPYKDKTLPTFLRNFLGYLFKCGLTPSNVALAVPSVAQRYQARLPRHLTPDQVETLLAAVRADPKNGRRNYAMILVMARLGLRAPEIIAIQLDDIDWRAGELLVRGKGQLHDRVPIPPDVGEALTAYIRQDRVSGSRVLFVSERAQHGPFKDGQILNAILKNAFAATGLKPPCPYVGSHVLRHSLATNMVLKGASLAEIGNMLRHRCRSSTMIYARLDIDALRSLAQPWPAGGAQ